MTTLGNFLWIVTGGLFMALAWWLAGAIMVVTVLGIPWARSCFVLGKMCLLPFGSEVISRKDLTGRKDFGTGVIGLLGNILWFVLGGWWLGIFHAILAVFLGMTVIGIPFAVQHLKLATLALWPVGRTVVDKMVAREARRQKAEGSVRKARET